VGRYSNGGVNDCPVCDAISERSARALSDRLRAHFVRAESLRTKRRTPVTTVSLESGVKVTVLRAKVVQTAIIRIVTQDSRHAFGALRAVFPTQHRAAVYPVTLAGM